MHFVPMHPIHSLPSFFISFQLFSSVFHFFKSHHSRWLHVFTMVNDRKYAISFWGCPTFGPLWQIICVWIPYDLRGSCGICQVLLCKTQWGSWTCSINSHQKPMPHLLTQTQVVHIHQRVGEGGERGGKQCLVCNQNKTHHIIRYN